MGDDADMIPVRDHNRRNDDRDGFAARSQQQRRMVAKWSRDDLEDKYLRMYEESIILKKHARKQEDKIKRMATKLLRLVSDKKKEKGEGGGKRDIETEEMLEELQSKIRDLEKQNGTLREKLMVTKQQMQTTSKRSNAYGHVSARIHTGIPRAPPDPRIAKSMRVSGPPPMSQRHNHTQSRDRRPLHSTPDKNLEISGIASGSQPRYGHSILEETRAENRHLESVIEQLNEQMNLAEQDIELLKEQMRMREAEYEEDLLKLKQQMSAGQRTAIQENIDVIKLQREVKEKSTRLTQLQGQYQNLEEKLRVVRGSHDQVLGEMEKLNLQLQEEQNKVLQVKNELDSRSGHARKVVELQERITDLERECEILRDANEKLVSSAFDMEHERQWRQRENALKVQIAQLEATLKSDVGEKGSILDKLTEERESHDKMEEDHRELRIKFFEVKQEADDLREKMKFFTKESAVDFGEIEEALMLIKSRKAKEDQDLSFLEKVDEEKVKDYEKLIRELQAEHADTIHELEKTRNMLIVQHKINKDYQMEVSVVSKKMEDNKSEYESKLEEYAQLLDIRASRIRKLESQLRDVAYGTKQYKLQPTDADAASDEEVIDETIHLERGQNLFEIHVKRIVLSEDGLEALGDSEPSVFATWEFYEYEIQATPVMKGPRSEYQFTSQYLVKVDDFFLHYIQKDSTTLELHQSFGTDYKTVAACQLKMRDLLDQSSGRLYSTVQLTGVEGGGVGVHYGTVEYWVRLRVPMAQALRLYKERAKALGYLQSNQAVAEQALEAMDEAVAKRPPDNVNQLHIKIIRCDSLVSQREGIQPSPFAVYKFFDYNDHDTQIVPGSNDPQFNDHKTFPVPMTIDVDKYMKSSNLHVYIFDDTDPDEATYIGVAKIPLLPLAHDKSVKGIFELHRKDGPVSGSVEVHMKWQYTYMPPKASARTQAQQMLRESIDDPERLVMMKGEQQAMEDSTILAAAPGPMAPPMTPVPRKKKPLLRVEGASATSTPTRQPEPPRPVARALRTAPPVMAEIPQVNIIPDTPQSIEQEPEVEPQMQEEPPSAFASLSEPILTSTAPSVTPVEAEVSDDEVSEISEGSHVTGESEPISELDDADMTGSLALPTPLDVSVRQPRGPNLDTSMETGGDMLATAEGGVTMTTMGDSIAESMAEEIAEDESDDQVTENVSAGHTEEEEANRMLYSAALKGGQEKPLAAGRAPRPPPSSSEPDEHMMSSKPPAATHLSADLEDGTSEDEQDDIPEEVIENQATLAATIEADVSEEVTEVTASLTEGLGESTMYSEGQFGATESEMGATTDMAATGELGTMEDSDYSPHDWSPKPLPRRSLLRSFGSRGDDHDEDSFISNPVLMRTALSDDETEMTETQTTETDKTESHSDKKSSKGKKDKGKKSDNNKSKIEEESEEESEEEEEEEEEVKPKARFSLFGRKDKDKEKEKKEKEKKEKEKKEKEKKEKEKKEKEKKEKEKKEKEKKEKDKKKGKGKDKDEEEEEEDEDNASLLETDKGKDKKDKDKGKKSKDKRDKSIDRKGKSKKGDESEDEDEDEDEDEEEKNKGKDKKSKDKSKEKSKDKRDKSKDRDTSKSKDKSKKGDKSEDEESEEDEEDDSKNEKDKAKDKKGKDKGKDKSKDKRDKSKDRKSKKGDKEEDSESEEDDEEDEKEKTKDKKGKDKRDKSKDRADKLKDKDEEEEEGKKTKSRFSLWGSKGKDKDKKEKEKEKDKKDKDKKDKKKKDGDSKEDTLTEDDPRQSTMFGDEEDSDAEEVSRVTSPRGNDSEDSDIIVSKNDSRPGSRISQGHGNADTVTITITKVTIDEGAAILKRKDIQMLFVEYRFLNVPLEETETPFSLPKPKGGQSITFNFTKVVAIDFEANYERRQFLASMLLPNDPEKGRVKFTVVSEPPEDNDQADCEDVGAAYISLPDILKKGKDVTEEDVPIHDVSNPKKVIGHIQLSFECLSALQAVKSEMEA